MTFLVIFENNWFLLKDDDDGDEEENNHSDDSDEEDTDEEDDVEEDDRESLVGEETEISNAIEDIIDEYNSDHLEILDSWH